MELIFGPLGVGAGFGAMIVFALLLNGIPFIWVFLMEVRGETTRMLEGVRGYLTAQAGGVELSRSTGEELLLVPTARARRSRQVCDMEPVILRFEGGGNRCILEAQIPRIYSLLTTSGLLSQPKSLPAGT